VAVVKTATPRMRRLLKRSPLGKAGRSPAAAALTDPRYRAQVVPDKRQGAAMRDAIRAIRNAREEG
jgi:hypothetical protein